MTHWPDNTFSILLWYFSRFTPQPLSDVVCLGALFPSVSLQVQYWFFWFQVWRSTWSSLDIFHFISLRNVGSVFGVIVLLHDDSSNRFCASFLKFGRRNTEYLKSDCNGQLGRQKKSLSPRYPLLRTFAVMNRYLCFLFQVSFQHRQFAST